MFWKRNSKEQSRRRALASERKRTRQSLLVESLEKREVMAASVTSTSPIRG